MFVSENIVLPRDQYAHPDAPTEWWWHIGTVHSGDRDFGFEINATRNGKEALGAYAFSQIMVSDVASEKHYHRTTVQEFDPGWAESDPAKSWYVRLPGDAKTSGAILMNGPAGDPNLMTAYATFDDAETGKRVTISLTLRQEGPPLLVWGTGISEEPWDKKGRTPIERYNYYYSYTNVHAKGTIAIGADVYDVEGVTWMDHEYGAFGSDEHWTLGDAQLENGVCFSTYTLDEKAYPKVGQPLESVVSMISKDGKSTYYKGCTTTPCEPTWTGRTGIVYCLTQKVEIPGLKDTLLTFASSLTDQEFQTETDPIYEGVGRVTGTLNGEKVAGKAWIEQTILPPKAAETTGTEESEAEEVVEALVVAEAMADD
jgi:predicted secreted hydrolase